MIKTFRGLITTGTIDTIALHTNDGSTGYRIVKFDCITKSPRTVSVEAVTKIYSVSQTTTDADIDFSDQTLLGVNYYEESGGVGAVSPLAIIFDKMVFNQDIYVTYHGTGSTQINYYIELELVKLDINENTVATLKDIRNIKRTATG